MPRVYVVDREYIENINYAMVMALELQFRMFGKQLVLEDGKITEVHTPYKVIKGK